MKNSISAVPAVVATGNEYFHRWLAEFKAQQAKGLDLFTPDLIRQGVEKETAFVLGAVYAATSAMLQVAVSTRTTIAYDGAWDKMIIRNDGTIEVHRGDCYEVIGTLEGFGFGSYEDLVDSCVREYESNLDGDALSISSLNKPVSINPTLMAAFLTLVDCAIIDHLTTTVRPGVIEISYAKNQNSWKLATNNK